MGDDSSEMHFEDDKGSVEKKNKKRVVKTATQLQALEKFFNEHKYPTEELKIQFAEALGLSEKQVSGWFCHRRLKDKKLMSINNNHIRKQDRSSGVVQDRGSGHKQDSCGSTKQGDDQNFDNKEFESGRLMSKDHSAVDLAQEHCNHYDSEEDTSSGSGSLFDNEATMYLVPKPELERRSKVQSGPSGYLKLKNQVENPVITAVKKQLGKHYRDEGPPLSVKFDPLPPGAFEFPVQNRVHERYYSTEAIPPVALSDASRAHPNPKFVKGRDCEPSMASFKGHEFCSPNSYTNRNFGQTTHPGNNGSYSYYPHRASSIEQYEGSTRNIQQRRPWPGHHQPYDGKMRGKPAESHKFSALSSHLDNGFSRQNFKPQKRINEEHLPVLYNFPRSNPVARYGMALPQDLSDDEGSAETSSSVD